MSTHLKLNFLVQCFNGSNNSETQSHDDGIEGVLCTEKSVSVAAFSLRKRDDEYCCRN